MCTRHPPAPTSRPRTLHCPMLVWTTWLALALQALRLIVAEPGPMPSQFPALSALVAKYAGDQAGKPDPWPIIADAEAIYLGVKTDVETRFAGNVRDDHVPFSPTVLEDRPAFDDDQSLAMQRDAALYGMALLEQRGLWSTLAKLPTAASTLCADLAHDHIQNPETTCLHARDLRALAMIFGVRMELAAASGDWDQYTAAFEQALAFSRALAYQPGTLCRVLSHATANRALARVVGDARLGRIPGDNFRTLLASLDRQRAVPPLRFELEVRAHDMRVHLDRTHSPDGDFLIHEWLNGVGSGFVLSAFHSGDRIKSTPLDWPELGRFVNAAGVCYARREESAAKCDEFTARLLVLDHQPYRSQLLAANALSDWALELPGRYLCVASAGLGATAGLTHFLRIQTDHAALRRGAETLLAIEAYRAEHNRLPATLDALMPAYLSAPPIDPYGNGPLKYRITDPNVHRIGEGYVLYSVWEDALDDNGKRGQFKQQLHSVSAQRTGCDLIINDDQDARNR